MSLPLSSVVATRLTRSHEELNNRRRKAVTDFQAEQALATERMHAFRDALLHVLREYMPEMEAYEAAYVLAETLISVPERYRVDFAERVLGLDDQQYVDALTRCYAVIRRVSLQWGDV